MRSKTCARVLGLHSTSMPRVSRCFFLFGLAQGMRRAAPGTARSIFRGYNIRAIGNIERCWECWQALQHSGSGRGFERGWDIEKIEALLQAVHGVHHALELWPINQVEGALFSGEHFQSYPPGRGDHTG